MGAVSTPRRNGKRANSTGAGRPTWKRLTRAQRERFLELVRQGMDRSQATAAVGAPALSFRALCRHDPRFEADYEEARRAGYDPIAEKLRRRLVDLALDPENDSVRPIQLALQIYDLEVRRILGASRVELTGADGGPLEHRTSYDLERLTDAELDSLHAFLSKAARPAPAKSG
jgi:hypothetical protein